jgi:hypothetical protein
MNGQDARDSILRHLGHRPSALFVREPLVDPLYPQTSDADVLAFADVPELLPERLNLPVTDGALPIDVIWLPTSWLHDVRALARQGLIAHRLAGSTLLSDPHGFATGVLQALQEIFWQPDASASRLHGFMEMGHLAVREIGVTRDFPPLALFWLHTAFAAGLCTLTDAAGRLCPNVYTRPIDALRALPRLRALGWERRLIEALRLDRPAQTMIEPLQALYSEVAARFPEPEWPAAMRATTRAEYRYFLAREELDWRIGVAREMIARGENAAAVYYLRFWAYALARIPMVWHCARAGRDVSFVRPERAAGIALREQCPGILPLLETLLAGPSPIDAQELEAAVDTLSNFRRHIVDTVHNVALPDDAFKPWIPFVSKPSPASALSVA